MRSLFQWTNRFLLEKLGSLVRLTPSLLIPISSPGVGIWVRWTSQPRTSVSFSKASWAVGLVEALMLRQIKTSSTSRLTAFAPRIFCLRFRMESIMAGERRWIRSGISASFLMAFRMRLGGGGQGGGVLPGEVGA